ncbi:MAG: mandelate racemase/muconate lactonizing enzyme family protein [Opitutaceae bacterium]
MFSHSRRHFLSSGLGTFCAASLPGSLLAATPSSPPVKLTGVELLPVRATERTVWLFVRLQTDSGVTGLGEASDAFGYFNTTRPQAAQMAGELKMFFSIVQGRSPFDIAWLRKTGAPRALAGGLVAATAYSAIEQAMWDVAGKLLNQPIYTMLGGKLRDRLPVYANINRATRPRTPAGFAATASRAVADGFRALKLAPFDGFKQKDFTDPAKSKPVADGIACIAAVREAVGDSVQVMVDAHSLFDVALSIEVAHRLEPYRLTWYEEPVAPEMVAETSAIRRAIQQEMAGGETLFQMSGFAPLCQSKAVEVIMPDVKHCGGLLELTHIAALAAMTGVAVAPHNPSGPVSTAVSVHACATVGNFRTLELQWGEVPWRSEIVIPPEAFQQGEIAVPDRPGCGVTLNDQLAQKYLL